MDLNIVSELFLQISCIWYLVIGIFVCVAPNYDSIHSSALLNGIVCVQGFHLTVESREMTGKEGRARGRNAEWLMPNIPHILKYNCIQLIVLWFFIYLFIFLLQLYSVEAKSLLIMVFGPWHEKCHMCCSITVL